MESGRRASSSDASCYRAMIGSTCKIAGLLGFSPRRTESRNGWGFRLQVLGFPCARPRMCRLGFRLLSASSRPTHIPFKSNFFKADQTCKFLTNNNNSGGGTAPPMLAVGTSAPTSHPDIGWIAPRRRSRNTRLGARSCRRVGPGNFHRESDSGWHARRSSHLQCLMCTGTGTLISL